MCIHANVLVYYYDMSVLISRTTMAVFPAVLEL